VRETPRPGRTAERRVVAIVAKAPRAGDVKTRLCPPLDPAGAARLSRAFLLDKIEQVRGLDGVGHAIVYAPEEARPVFLGLAPDFALTPQRGRDLGERLVASFAELFAEGYEAVLLIDSDTPTLPTEYLLEALDLIAKPEVDLVIGPSEDGGYYLVGLRAPRPTLFEGIPWSTPAVLAETLERARRLGLGVRRLPLWWDVDTGSDLARLQAQLAATPGPGPRHTRRVVAARATTHGS
jgi:rSAM/selenodomain-associated transferase 1